MLKPEVVKKELAVACTLLVDIWLAILLRLKSCIVLRNLLLLCLMFVGQAGFGVSHAEQPVT
jgi:hypothetical protein